MTEFVGFPKVPRLNRPIVISEKLDGTNGCVVVDEVPYGELDEQSETVSVFLDGDADALVPKEYRVYAQSRKRIITPKEDNHGFAAWVWENAENLVRVLGPGRHFGELWGSGINRGYGLPKGEKRFSLFNTRRWDVLSEQSNDQPLGVHDDWTDVPGLRVVPTIAQFDTFDTNDIKKVMSILQLNGSFAAPGFMNPEGIIIYHRASNGLFKVTLENDQEPKSLAEKPPRTDAEVTYAVREAMETRAQYA